MQTLQEQATQTADTLATLRDLQLFDQITFHSLAAVVTACCVVLLFRTAAGTQHSRFLRCLAYSIALNMIFRLGKVVVYLLKTTLAFLTAGHEGSVEGQVAKNVARTLVRIDSTWHGIDITISLLSSLFLVTTWHLLRNYPKEGIDRSLYSTLTAVFGTGIIGVLSFLLNLAEWIQKHLWLMLDIMDVTCATVGLWLVGWQLQKTLGPIMKAKSGVLRATLPLVTAFAYFIWGSLQPLYPWLKDSSWYPNLLLMWGVSAVIMTIILCSNSLEEKPEYHSGAAAHPSVAPTHLRVLPAPQGGSGTQPLQAQAASVRGGRFSADVA